MTLHRALFDILLRAGDETEAGSMRTLKGHAAVFNQKGETPYFTEEIAPGAFRDTIEDGHKIFALWNHNYNFPLCSTEGGALVLREDETGLYNEITPTDTSYARDLVKNIEGGHIDKMSFGFRILDEDFDSRPALPHFIIKKVELIEVSPVTLPFYDGTDIQVKSAEEAAEFCNFSRSYTAESRVDRSPEVMERLKQRISKHRGSNTVAIQRKLDHIDREIEFLRLATS